MSLSKSTCWYSNNCLHFSKCAIQLLKFLTFAVYFGFLHNCWQPEVTKNMVQPSAESCEHIKSIVTSKNNNDIYLGANFSHGTFYFYCVYNLATVFLPLQKSFMTSYNYS